MSRTLRVLIPSLLLAVGAHAESMADWEAHQRSRTEEAKANSGITSSNFSSSSKSGAYSNLDLSIPRGLSEWADRDQSALTPQQVAANAAYQEAYDKSMAAVRGKPWGQTVKDAEGGDAAAELEVGYAYDRGQQGLSADPRLANEWFQRAADHGSTRAAYELGASLFNANATKPEADMTAAVRWLRVAADGGEPKAFSPLAWCCLEKRGIQAEPEETFRRIRIAAEAGDEHWNGWMSYCYDTGFGTAKDPAQAFAWAKKGAEAGDATLMYDVGIRYTEGDGVEADATQAFLWKSKALAAGKREAAYDVGEALVFGNGTVADEARGVALVRQSAADGVAAAQGQMAVWMVDGKRGVDVDVPRALELLRLAMDQGLPSAYHEMGILLQNGRPPYLEADDVKSFECLRKALDLGGDESVAYILGMYYVLGKGTTRDPDTGVPLVMGAAEKGDAKAQYQASRWLMHGQHMPSDPQRGVGLLQDSANQGNLDALMDLAALYARGAFGGSDPKAQRGQAVELYRKAAELGSDEARAKLAELGGD